MKRTLLASLAVVALMGCSSDDVEFTVENTTDYTVYMTADGEDMDNVRRGSRSTFKTEDGAALEARWYPSGNSRVLRNTATKNLYWTIQ